MNKTLLYKLVFLSIFSLIFSSCYENYLVINSDFKSAEITTDSSKIFFFHILKAGQPPKGISKFPVGGTRKTIYKNVSLYSINTLNSEIEKIIDFGDIPYESWNYNISIHNNTLVVSICPITGWNWAINSFKSNHLTSLYDKHHGFYKYDIKEKNLKRFIYEGYDHILSPDENQIVYLKRDSLNIEIWHFQIDENKNQFKKKLMSNTAYFPMYWIDNNKIAYKENKNYNLLDLITSEVKLVDKELFPIHTSIPIKNVKKLTKQISFKEWGFDISNYWEQNKKQYINDIVILNGNLNYRNAILQTLSDNLTKNDIEDILDQMKIYGESLTGLEKTEYHIYSQETIELLNQYLD